MFNLAHTQLHTLRDVLRFAVSRFNEAKLTFGHGSVEAFDEAAYLILHTLHLPPDKLEPFLDARLTDDELAQVLTVIARRVTERVPASYLTHEAWLGDYKFYVDERVIVPRSFIAELLREQLAPWVVDANNIRSALDLCTGSGCLAIVMADAFPDAAITASDLSGDALEVARKNVEDYALGERIKIVQSDMFEKLAGQRFDLIISNPPYVNAASMQTLPQEFRHEPPTALGSGEDGLDATRKILHHAAQHLTDDGLLVVEIGHNRAALEAAYPRTPFTWLETASGDEFVFLLHREQL